MVSCVKELPELPLNIFADESIDLFSIEGVSFQFSSTLRRDVVVQFSSKYDELSELQKKKINKVVVSGSASFEMAVDQGFFVHKDRAIGATVCYNLAFKAVDGQKSRANTFCFKVE